jgi:alcohol dehydrogenase
VTTIFEVPERIVAGWGAISRLGEEVKSVGKNLLLVCSARVSDSEWIRGIVGQMESQRISVFIEPGDTGEPTVDAVEHLLQRAESLEVDAVIGIGGGSVLDTAKAVAGLKFPGRRPVKDYFYGQPIKQRGVPWIAVPTTSGTGSEATPNSVLSDGDNLKQSIRGDRSWLAKLVILDPELTVSCSTKVTAWSGLDALTQAIESYTSAGANVFTEPYSLKAASLIAGSLETACGDPGHRKARTDMAYGSHLAGIALANARLGIVHGVAHSIGLHYRVPHGLVCGTLLPWAIEFNQDVVGDKYARIAREMGAGSHAGDLIHWIRGINEKLNIPSSIKAFGVRKEDLPRIVEESMPSGSLKANPKPVSKEELARFLENQLL